MTDFVAECRREWKRLGVPDQIADEMAAELAADLEEAGAEGASAADVLGGAALDPRSFAAAWAAERGVVRRRPPRPRLLAAVGTFALAASIVGAVLIIHASPSAQRIDLEPGGTVWVAAEPDHPVTVSVGNLWKVAPAPPPLAARFATSTTSGSDGDTRTVGLVLLIAGLAGTVPVTMFGLWAGAGRRLRA